MAMRTIERARSLLILLGSVLVAADLLRGYR
jgi:hypothetical protein